MHLQRWACKLAWGGLTMGMERGIAHFLSPTCMTQPAFMDIIPNSINGAFQGNDTSQSFHSGQSSSLFASQIRNAVYSIYDLANWKTGNRKLRYNHTTPQSWSERNLVDVSQVLKCIFLFPGSLILAISTIRWIATKLEMWLLNLWNRNLNRNCVWLRKC